MVNHMWLFIGFLIVGAISGWIFKLVAAIFESIIIFPLFGFRGQSLGNAFLTKPKRLITVVIFKNVIIGLVNSLMILTVCYRFVVEYEGNYWLYFSLGVLWSLFIITDKSAFSGVFFWPSTVNFVLMWFGFGLISIIVVGLLTFAISLAYYYGRIEMMRQMYQDDDVIEVSS
jgi:hypothetical protein